MDTTYPETTVAAKAVLELAVRNHPGVMSHVCGLCARRAFDVEGIASLRVGNGEENRIWLLVNDDVRLTQMVRQLSKLPDVVSVALRGAEHPLFPGLARFLPQ